MQQGSDETLFGIGQNKQPGVLNGDSLKYQYRGLLCHHAAKVWQFNLIQQQDPLGNNFSTIACDVRSKLILNLAIMQVKYWVIKFLLLQLSCRDQGSNAFGF